MNFELIAKFLENQKRHMVMLDDASGANTNSRLGKEWSRKDATGRRISLREQLYQNTVDWIKSESGPKGVLFNEMMILSQPGLLKEDTLSTDITTFTTSLLPGIRRMFNNLYAMDLVSVQPLTGPSGYIWFLQKLFSDNYGQEGITGETTELQDARTKDYAVSGEKGTIRKIQLALKKQLIETGIRKLGADWTIESEQDMKSQWKLDVEAELTPELIDELGREIDHSIIRALRQGVAHTVQFDPTAYPQYDRSTVERDAYRKGIYKAIVDARAWVFQNKPGVDRGGVDWWLVMNGYTYAMIEKLEQFVASHPTADQSGAIGQFRNAGTLANLYKVYVDPGFANDEILLGIKGDWKMSVGYYAPYIPLFLSEKYIINDDFTQFRRGAMCRDKIGIVPEKYQQQSTNNGLVLINLAGS